MKFPSDFSAFVPTFTDAEVHEAAKQQKYYDPEKLNKHLGMLRQTQKEQGELEGRYAGIHMRNRGHDYWDTRFKLASRSRDAYRRLSWHVMPETGVQKYAKVEYGSTQGKKRLLPWPIHSAAPYVKRGDRSVHDQILHGDAHYNTSLTGLSAARRRAHIAKKGLTLSGYQSGVGSTGYKPKYPRFEMPKDTGSPDWRPDHTIPEDYYAV